MKLQSIHLSFKPYTWGELTSEVKALNMDKCKMKVWLPDHPFLFASLTCRMSTRTDKDYNEVVRRFNKKLQAFFAVLESRVESIKIS